MTRKRFWKLRNALNTRLYEWAKTQPDLDKINEGASMKAMRPVSGKPLVDFGCRTLEYIRSYDDVWNMDGMRDLRKNLGMD
jgi:hypothetical protein